MFLCKYHLLSHSLFFLAPFSYAKFAKFRKIQIIFFPTPFYLFHKRLNMCYLNNDGDDKKLFIVYTKISIIIIYYY